MMENRLKTNREFLQELYYSHLECPDFPSTETITLFLNELLGTLFPDFSKKTFNSSKELELHFRELKMKLGQMIFKSVDKNLVDGEQFAEYFFDELPGIRNRLIQDVKAMFDGDPVAKSPSEVIRSYPGFYAIAAYRIAHLLYQMNIQVIPRLITEIAHSKTGIDIHPGAQIGGFFCIDHGTGIVIGETTIIGNWVKVYQGVTLGALSVSKSDAKKKRHPTVEDNVTLYAGSTILGGATTVGHDSIIGGNVWLTKSVPPFTKIYYKAGTQNIVNEESDLMVFKATN